MVFVKKKKKKNERNTDQWNSPKLRNKPTYIWPLDFLQITEKPSYRMKKGPRMNGTGLTGSLHVEEGIYLDIYHSAQISSPRGPQTSI